MLKEIPPSDDEKEDSDDIEAEVEKNIDPDGMIVGRDKKGG